MPTFRIVRRMALPLHRLAANTTCLQLTGCISMLLRLTEPDAYDGRAPFVPAAALALEESTLGFSAYPR